MADPKEEQIENKIEETGTSRELDAELSDEDVEKVTGAGGLRPMDCDGLSTGTCKALPD